MKSSEPPATSNLDGALSGYLKKKRLRTILPFIPSGARVLDVGCDDGALLAHLPTCAYYLGLDREEAVIAGNRRRFPQDNASFACQSIDRFVWEGPLFSVVVMAAVVEHLDDLGAVLSRITPITTEDVLVLITTPAPVSRVILHCGAAVRLFARDSLNEHKKYFSRTDFDGFAGWRPAVYKRFEFGMNQLVLLRKAGPVAGEKP